MFRRSWKTELSAGQRKRGWIFLLLYLLVLPRLNAWVQQRAFGDGEILVAEANVVYYALLVAGVLGCFWSFLKEDLSGLLDWVPENLYSVTIGLSGGIVLRYLAGMLPLPVSDIIAQQYAEQYRMAPVPTLALILLLIPLVEEMVYRGFLYGQLREYSRPLGAVIITAVYALASVWRYALDFSDPRWLLLILLYLPKSAALTFGYENGGSVWGCMALHAGLNGFSLLMAL